VTAAFGRKLLSQSSHLIYRKEYSRNENLSIKWAVSFLNKKCLFFIHMTQVYAENYFIFFVNSNKVSLKMSCSKPKGESNSTVRNGLVGF